MSFCFYSVFVVFYLILSHQSDAWIISKRFSNLQPHCTRSTQLKSIFDSLNIFGPKTSEKPPKWRKKELDNASKDSKSTVRSNQTQTNDVGDQSRNASAGNSSVVRNRTTLTDPILGDLIADLGYKRVYLTSVSALHRTPVWKDQRILRRERYLLIADRMKQQLGLDRKPRLPGVITLFEDLDTKEVGIIDGQHRAGALHSLTEQDCWDRNERNILIEVFPTSGEDSISFLFAAINAAEPVREIDLPHELDHSRLMGTTGNTNDNQTKFQLQVKVIVNDAAESLKKKYKEMFKPTSRCRSPHVNIDALRDGLFGVDVVREGKYTTSQELMQQLEQINQQLLVVCHSDAQSKAMSAGEVNALEKANKYDFYLGMRKDWLIDNAFWQ